MSDDFVHKCKDELAAERGEISDDLQAALERMESMTPEELDAFRSSDSGEEFGACHLEIIKRTLAKREVTGSATDLLADVLLAEREGELPPNVVEAEDFLRGLSNKDPITGVIMPLRLRVVVEVGKIANGRMVDGWESVEGYVYANPVDLDPWSRGINSCVADALFRR